MDAKRKRWKTNAFFMFLGILVVGSVAYLWMQPESAENTLPTSFRPGAYEIDVTFSGPHQVERSRIIIHASTANYRSGTITATSFGNSIQDHGTWWINNGWLDASLVGPVVKKNETRHIHFLLTFSPGGVTTGYGRDLITSSLGNEQVVVVKMEAYQSSGCFLHS